MKKIVLGLLALLCISACQKKQGKFPAFKNEDISKLSWKMTDIMVHDATNPPLAARFFAYTCLAGYEVVAENDSSCKSMYGVLNDYPKISKPSVDGQYAYQLSALLAMIDVASQIQPSGSMFTNYEQQLIDSCRQNGFSDEVINNSKDYASAVSQHILTYMKSDGYNKISDYPRYSPLGGDDHWYPTPPAYFAAVEPYFYTIRPLVLDSAHQFPSNPPQPFDSKKGSGFYKLMKQDYDESVDQSTLHRRIASFWDCNPFAMKSEGHLMVGLKKITPGAHWMGIAGIVCQKEKVSFDKAMQINTVVSLSLMDAFMSSFYEKYKYNRVRPETSIREFIDPSWHPLLQTPPFPEYTSAHSCVSSSAAVVLSHYFGDHYHFKDSVEETYGIPPRSFDSFQQAAIEAGMSRLYGGIHFMDAIQEGRNVGLKVGNLVVDKTDQL